MSRRPHLFLAALLLLGLAASPAASSAPRAAKGKAKVVRVVDAAQGRAAGERAEPRAERAVVGGTVIGIRSAPWQVFVWSQAGDCGGSILNATTILTAAHCVDGATGVGLPPSQGGIQVWAGLSNIAPLSAPGDSLQVKDVSARRMHPFWKVGSVTTTGDIAVLTLSTALVLDGVTTQAVTLPPAGVPPSADAFNGQTLKLTGYGVSTAFGTEVDNLLRTATVTQADPDFCDDDNNAVTLCGRNPTGSSCQGDSGGPLVEAPAVPGAAPMQVGIVSNGPIGCAPDTPDFYTNLRAPEVRAFIDGPGTPPLAPRRGLADPSLTGPASMREGDTLTCAPGAFTGAANIETKLATDTGTVLAAATNGPVSFVLTAAQAGRTIRCRSYASSPGGVALSYVMAFTTAVTAKPVAPPVPIRDPKANGECTRSSGSGLSQLVMVGQARRTVRRKQTIAISFEASNLDPDARRIFIDMRQFREGKKRARYVAESFDLDKVLVAPGVYRFAVFFRVPKWAKVGKAYHLKFSGATFDRTSPSTEGSFGNTSLPEVCDLLPDRSLRIKIRR